MVVISKLSDVEGEPRLFQKRPVRVKALQLSTRIMIKTREGTLVGRPGDWLIEGVEGEVYPCDPKIFMKTYVEVATGGD